MTLQVWRLIYLKMGPIWLVASKDWDDEGIINVKGMQWHPTLTIEIAS
jgi:hypothetical protein